jgi:DNA-binding IclR family transcriptional regulator
MKQTGKEQSMLNNSPVIGPFSKTDVDSSDSFMTRAANVLTCLSEDKHTLSDIAKTCKMGASTAHRLLATLTKPGLVIYDQSIHRYYLGPRVAQISANPVTSHQILIMAANHEMERLSAVIEETTTLSLMVGIQYIPLHSIYSTRRLIILEEFRGIRPVLPLGSTDLILLSQLAEKELRRVLEIGFIWQGVEEKSNKDTDYWVKQIAQIRQYGYVVTRGEKVPGGLGISAPVENYFCPVALTVIGPEHRLEPILPNLIKELIGSAQLLSGIVKHLFPSKTSV